ncbi:hypothetical protein [Salinibacterium sp. TMP30]|uniref:hypothetical protein n=1 Tax=Salinibacterium sp. TMP30 TaxID=3138237 RepID=UPI003138D7B2
MGKSARAANKTAKLDRQAQQLDTLTHMIVTSKHLSMIFDPTFQQFAAEGLLPTPIAGKVFGTHPEDQTLVIEMLNGRIEITYYFDDANTGWQDGVAFVMPGWSPESERLASHIRSGGSAADMPFEIPWEDQPAR